MKRKSKLLSFGLLLILTASLVVLWRPHASSFSNEATERNPLRVVLWISLDGLRHDYWDRVESPFMDRLMSESLVSRELISVFPSLTFSSHVSFATGASVSEHGISLNSFYDRETEGFYSYPGDPSLLEAEPIWTTAARQGIRAASLDWVLSHAQEGEHRAEYFNPRYIGHLSDQERLQQVLDIWREDLELKKAGVKPLQLLMGYAVGPDSLGHQFGPDSSEVDQKMIELDTLLSEFWAEAMSVWNEYMSPEDELLFIVTTDHGMAEIEATVNIDALTDLHERFDVAMPTGGNIAHIFFDQLNEAEAEGLEESLRKRLADFHFVSVYSQDEIPADFGYTHANRIGDLVLVLDQGYAFARIGREILTPVTEDSPLKGMHGYDPQHPDMKGFALFWRYPQSFDAEEIGELSALHFHSTVAKWLGIEPSDQATPEWIHLPQTELESGTVQSPVVSD